MRQDIKIIYITGSGRSGSTITDILLSQGKNVTGLGELINVFTKAWSDNNYCACGKRALNCPFWSRVKEKWEDEANLTIPEYIQLQNEYNRNIHVPKILWNKYFPSKKFKVFAEDTKLLFQIIADISETRIFIDSSKIPYWLLTLKNMKLDVFTLHLVRNGRKVLKSKQKFIKKDLSAGVQNELKPKPTLKVALRWIFLNFMAELLHKNKKYLRIRYEDLTINPQKTLDMVSSKFNINLQEAKNKINQDDFLYKGHTVAGSRLRMKPEIKFKQEEKNRMSQKKSVLFNFIIYPFLKKYGYK